MNKTGYSFPLLNRKLPASDGIPAAGSARLPDPAVFDLPERVLQFGSGRFLRGFADAFIHDANEQGAFDGRVVIVQSTGRKRAEQINEQDGLYTLSIRGFAEGRQIEDDRIIASISRAVSASEQWDDVLALAGSPLLSHIISNTTEAGLAFDSADGPDCDPPRSFPGKLTAVLHERYRRFDADETAGLIVLPCELVENNGSVLRDLVLATAQSWSLSREFIGWIENACIFCHSLVDRIVPGSPSEDERGAYIQRLGYRDGMQTVAESYYLWAIEGADDLKKRVPFSSGTDGIVIAPNIQPYRDRKVRILNGAHSAIVPLGILCGNETVLDAMRDDRVAEFLNRLVHHEIVPSLDVDRNEAAAFADAVLDRFRNPFLHHRHREITLNHLSKVRVRVIPSILAYTRKRGRLPRTLVFGLAASLFYLRDAEIDDQEAERVRTWWNDCSNRVTEERVSALLRSEQLWGAALHEVSGLPRILLEDLTKLLELGPANALACLLEK